MSNCAQENPRTCVITDFGHIVPLSNWASNISGVASYEFRNVREGLIILTVWLPRYVPAVVWDEEQREPPSPPWHPLISHHHETPPKLGPRDLRCCIDPSSSNPEIKIRITVSNLARNIRLALTHILNRLSPKLQYIYICLCVFVRVVWPSRRTW